MLLVGFMHAPSSMFKLLHFVRDPLMHRSVALSRAKAILVLIQRRTTHVIFVPFRGRPLSQYLEECLGFISKQTVDREVQWCKAGMFLLTGSRVLSFLLIYYYYYYCCCYIIIDITIIIVQHN